MLTWNAHFFLLRWIRYQTWFSKRNHMESMFDREFILKTIRKQVSISGEFVPQKNTHIKEPLITLSHLLVLLFVFLLTWTYNLMSNKKHFYLYRVPSLFFSLIWLDLLIVSCMQLDSIFRPFFCTHWCQERHGRHVYSD